MLELPVHGRVVFGMLLLVLSGCAGGMDVPALAPPWATPAAIAPVEVAPDAALPDAAEADASHLLLDLKGDRELAESPLASVPAAAPSERASAATVASRPSGTEIGYLLIDLESGQTLAELNPDLPLIPASTTKLATAVVALDVLGPDHRYRTELLVQGVVEEGVLQGDLILKGGGDPALDVADLLGLVVRLETSGIRRVEGRFLVDDMALPRLSEIEPTQPLEAAYNPGIGALSLAFNRVRVSWRGGATVRTATLPPLEEAIFEPAPPRMLPPSGIELKTAGGDAVVWRVADRGRRYQERSLPVKDPGLHAGRFFHRLAAAQGIELGPPLRGTAYPGAQLLAVHESVPLRRLLRDMLVYSNNMMAELIGLSAAARLGNTSSGLDAAGELLLRHLQLLMPEVDWQDAALGNHSGLDGEARLTPRQLAAIAHYGWRTDALPALLPGGGWSGTLANRFDDPSNALRVWAKTGTVNYGSALAGYLFPASDRPAVFVTMVSDLDARATYDALPRPTRSANGAANAWNARARALQDDLVEGWLGPLPTS